MSRPKNPPGTKCACCNHNPRWKGSSYCIGCKREKGRIRRENYPASRPKSAHTGRDPNACNCLVFGCTGLTCDRADDVAAMAERAGL